MSNAIMNLVWPLDLRPMEKLILIALADRADDRGVCWPSVEDIMARTGATRRTVQRSISSLEIAGHLSRARVPGKPCGYRLHPRHCGAPHESDVRQCGAPPRHSDAPTRASVTPQGRHSDALTLIEPSDEPSDEPSASSRAINPTLSKVKRAREGKAETAIPEDFEPNLGPKRAAMVAAWPDGMFEEQLERFRAHALRNQRLTRDWDAAFGTWADRADKGLEAYGHRPDGWGQRYQMDGATSYMLAQIRRGASRAAIDEDLALARPRSARGGRE